MNTLMVLGALGVVYFMANVGFGYIPVSLFVRTYLAQPVLWGLLAWLVLRLPQPRLGGKTKERSTFIGLAVMAGITQIMVYAIGGLFSNFGRNPSSLTLQGIATNLMFVSAGLLGTETSRSWLVNRLGKRHPAMSLALVTVVFTVVSIPLTQLTGLKVQIESVSQVNSSWLPLLMENLLATMLARLAGPRASLAYRGPLAAFWWFCPIIPDLPWAMKGLIGAAVPIFGLLVANSLHSAEANRGKPRRLAREAAFPAGMIITAVFSLGLVWFAAGLFPLKPSSIASGSMLPLYEVGDIVIVAKVSPGTIKTGDIVEFRRQEGAQAISIVHRVIGIDEKAKTFTTKGDANNAPDVAPVQPQNVVGKVVFNIPKLGMLSLILKQFFTG